MKETCRVFYSQCDTFKNNFMSYSKFNDPKLEKIINLRKSTASVKQLLHFAQNTATGFYQFDYNNDEENKFYYNGRTTPPILDLNKISEDVKISLINGDQDEILNQECVDKIRDELGDRVKSNIIIKDFVHHSFSVSKNMKWT